MPGTETVGHFVWERGLRGPIPVKVAPQRYHLGAFAKDWEAVTIAIAPLTAAQWDLPLDVLARQHRHLLPAEVPA